MLDLCKQFQLDSDALSCKPYGSGHINATWLVETEKGTRYVLQKLSREAFHDIPALMNNIEKVTSYLARRESDPRRTLRLIPSRQGSTYIQGGDGDYYRMYAFIARSVSIDRPQRENDLYECAYAFGGFQRALEGFPARELNEIIPGFHDTPGRYRALKAAVQEDPLGRARETAPEIAFALAREEEAGTLMRLLREGELPLRVTHNDTKLNNVMLDEETHEAVCVIDLDTVMPGLSAFDFGDLARFGANTGAEDEKDLSRIGLSLANFEQLLRGFLAACGDSLTEKELSVLPLGGKLMTLECGVRFLTDYLMGDVYFHIQRPEHNLDRCRTQFRLVESMEEHWEDMQRILKETM